MELAPYGTPDLKKEIGQLIQLRRGGEFELDLSYFSHGSGEASMTWDDGEPKLSRVFSAKLETLLGPARTADQPLTERHGAIAASLQAVFEDAVFHVLNGLHALIPAPSLCLAGSCALNSVANGKIRERTPFQEVFIQPAAGDDGTALGAAYSVWNQTLAQPRRFVMKHAYWGPSFDETEIQAALDARASELALARCVVSHFHDSRTLTEFAADQIAKGQVVGWFQDRMEWGARVLGNRSILANPRRADMPEIIDTRIGFAGQVPPVRGVDPGRHARRVLCRLWSRSVHDAGAPDTGR